MPTEIEKITQRRLLAAVKLKNKISDAEEELEKLRAELSDEYTVLMGLLENKVPIEPGKLSVTIETTTGAVRPPWKDIHVKHMTEEHGADKTALEQGLRELYPGETKRRVVIGGDKEQLAKR